MITSHGPNRLAVRGPRQSWLGLELSDDVLEFIKARDGIPDILVVTRVGEQRRVDQALRMEDKEICFVKHRLAMASRASASPERSCASAGSVKKSESCSLYRTASWFQKNATAISDGAKDGLASMFVLGAVNAELVIDGVVHRANAATVLPI